MEPEGKGSVWNSLVPVAFEALKKDRRVSELRGLTLSVVAILVGLAITGFSHSKDLGIGAGLVTSGFVTLIYELHSRAQKDRETIAGILKLVYNDIVVDGFWEEIEKELFARKFIRKNATIEIDFLEDPSLLGKLRIRLKFSYDLSALRPASTTIHLTHRLNFHIEDKKLNLPRFEMVRIGDHFARDRDALAECSTRKQPFRHQLTIRHKNKEIITVRVSREELSYIPGTYNFVLAEMTSGIAISSDSVPDGLKVTVALRPGEHPKELHPSAVPIKDRKLFLPGSCIEFRLEDSIGSAEPIQHDAILSAKT
jgi:hypothetical protein